VPVQNGSLAPEVSSAALPARRMLRCGRKPLAKLLKTFEPSANRDRGGAASPHPASDL